jgi:hypothetical protein
MDMRMKIEARAEGMHNRSNAWHKALCLTPFVESIRGGMEEEVLCFTESGEKTSTNRQEERRRCGDRRS